MVLRSRQEARIGRHQNPYAVVSFTFSISSFGEFQLLHLWIFKFLICGFSIFSFLVFQFLHLWFLMHNFFICGFSIVSLIVDFQHLHLWIFSCSNFSFVIFQLLHLWFFNCFICGFSIFFNCCFICNFSIFSIVDSQHIHFWIFTFFIWKDFSRHPGGNPNIQKYAFAGSQRKIGLESVLSVQIK